MVELARTNAIEEGSSHRPLAVAKASSKALGVRALSLDEARPLWANFTSLDPFGVAQTLLWVSTWAECVNPDIIVGALFDGDVPVLLLPLEIFVERGVGIARYVGGTHANANFPIIRQNYASAISSKDVSALCRAIRQSVPMLDALVLTRQLTELNGARNPMLALPSIESPNLALSFTINAEFETLIKDRSGARKLKKMRQQSRRMDERGGWECIVPMDVASIDTVLDCFFVMKAKRFEEFGLKDTFKVAKIKAFFRMLYREAATASDPAFKLDALRVGGEILAVAGSSIRHNSNIVEFGAVRAHEPTLSPGDFLFHQMIKKACEDKFVSFDFGVGDEVYKRAWCDIITHHADSTIAFTVRGWVYVTLFRTASKAKLAIKRNAFLTGQLKKWRMRNVPKPDTAPTEE